MRVIPKSTNYLVIALLLLGFYLNTNSFALAQERKEFRVPKAIVKQLLKNEELVGSIQLDANGNALNLVAARLNLRPNARAEILEVHGINSEICGANNCVSWIYEKTPKGYRLLLDAGAISGFEVQKSVTNDYRDVIARGHASAWESGLALYKFDGTKYRLSNCYNRNYSYLDKQGKLHELKRPIVKQIKCND
jgi:hypothetical protein